MTVPLKLKDSAAPTELQVFSSTEENYLAYQAGLHLASQDSSDVGSLALSTHGTENLVGLVVDTSYDSAVGTGGDQATLTFTTVTTPLRQTRGTITPSGANNRLPIMQRDSDGQRVIREMNDSDMDSLLTRVGSRIFTSDYPGSYKLATSTPAGGYTSVKTLTTDTRTDGTNISYNLYRRTSMTAPTKVLPFSIKRSGGDTGTYQGFQLMTDDQVKYSIGTRLQNKISSDTTDIGNYRIYSSAAGTPTNNGLSGTWTSKGTVTDTRQAIVDANYTRSRASTYTRLRTSTYAGEYARTRSSIYARTSLTNFSRDYTATYSKTRTSLYTVTGFVGNFVGNYTNTRIDDFTRGDVNVDSYTRNTIVYTVQGYSRAHEYLGTYTRNSAGLRGGNFVGDYSRSSTNVHEFSRNVSESFTGNYSRTDIYTGNYQGNYLGNFIRDRLTAASDGVNYARDYTGDYSRNYLGNYSREYLRDRITDRTATRIAYTVDDNIYIRETNRETNYSRGFLGDYLGNYARNYLGDFSRNYTGTYSRDYLRTRIFEDAIYGSFEFIGDYTGDVEKNFARVTRTTNYSRDFFRTRQPTRQSNYIGDFLGNFLGNFLGDYTGDFLGNFLGDYTGNYTRQFIGDYSRNFVSTRSSNYLGEDAFSRDFAGEFIGNYARNFTNTFVGDYSRNFVGNFTGDYARHFTGNYSRNFIGNYAGETIGSGNTNIETYTLYVRTA